MLHHTSHVEGHLTTDARIMIEPMRNAFIRCALACASMRFCISFIIFGMLFRSCSIRGSFVCAPPSS